MLSSNIITFNYPYADESEGVEEEEPKVEDKPDEKADDEAKDETEGETTTEVPASDG